MAPAHLIEICVDNHASVLACAAAGCHRIELCAGLAEGGTTPSLGFLRQARRVFSGKIMMMLRPRRGDFLYTPEEIAIMLEDAALAADHGADGVVFGCLTPQGAIDEANTARLLAAAANLGLDGTFHRAFDVCESLPRALETLVSLGVPRVLTSGGKPSAMDALHELRQLHEAAAGRIRILPGGGITAAHVSTVLRATGVAECHLSARQAQPSGMTHRRPDIPMGATAIPGEYELKVASEALVRLALVGA